MDLVADIRPTRKSVVHIEAKELDLVQVQRPSDKHPGSTNTGVKDTVVTASTGRKMSIMTFTPFKQTLSQLMLR